MPQLALHSPYGDLTLSEEDGKIVSLDWGWPPSQESSPGLEAAKTQLCEYFDGIRTSFDLPLDPWGTDFQRRVWRALLDIPHGQTCTYGELAKRVNNHARAVGHACGLNPIPIIIPCHRVLAKNGKPGGYSGDGGIETKKRLLNLEQAAGFDLV